MSERCPPKISRDGDVRSIHCFRWCLPTARNRGRAAGVVEGVVRLVLQKCSRPCRRCKSHCKTSRTPTSSRHFDTHCGAMLLWACFIHFKVLSRRPAFEAFTTPATAGTAPPLSDEATGRRSESCTAGKNCLGPFHRAFSQPSFRRKGPPPSWRVRPQAAEICRQLAWDCGTGEIRPGFSGRRDAKSAAWLSRGDPGLWAITGEGHVYNAGSRSRAHLESYPYLLQTCVAYSVY